MSNLAKVVITLLGFACWLFNAPPVMCLPVFIALVRNRTERVHGIRKKVEKGKSGSKMAADTPIYCLHSPKSAKIALPPCAFRL